MSALPIATPMPFPVTVTGNRVIIHDLTITHGEAAAIVRAHLDAEGQDSLTDLIRRALPVGLIALSLGHAAIDTGAIVRTLDGFADKLTAGSDTALSGLDQTLARLEEGERAVARTTADILATLPAQVEAALSGQAGSVRAAVSDATSAVQAAGLTQIRSALAQHTESVRNAISLDHEGPVQALRRDLLEESKASRQELAGQLAVVRGLLEAAHASKAAAVKSTRAVGLIWEAEAMAICQQIATAAGDRFEATGAQPAPGGTSRAGDGVITLSSAITGPRRELRIVVEAKKRSRPLTARQFRDEVENVRTVRDAAAGLVLVPTAAEVPGGCKFSRVANLAFVVAADDPETVSLVYLILREMTALLTVRQNDGTIDHSKIETHLELALTALSELDDIARLAGQAQNTLQTLKTNGAQTQKKIREALITSLAVLHP